MSCLQLGKEVVEFLPLLFGDPCTALFVFAGEAVGVRDEGVDGGQVVLQGVEVLVAFFGGFEVLEVSLYNFECDFEIIYRDLVDIVDGR